MKQNEILKVMAEAFGIAAGTVDVAELNKVLKSKEAPQVKFKIKTTKSTHFGFTGLVKMVTPDGLKVFDVNKVTLIRFDDMESFEKAGPRVERPVRPKKVEEAPVKKIKPPKVAAASEDEEDEADDFDEYPVELKSRKKQSAGKAGSAFIPKAKK